MRRTVCGKNFLFGEGADYIEHIQTCERCQASLPVSRAEFDALRADVRMLAVVLRRAYVPVAKSCVNSVGDRQVLERIAEGKPV